MLAYIIFILSFTIGSYKKEVLDEDLNEKIGRIEPLVHKYWEEEGYNGIYPQESNDELWSQIVNGKNYIFKKSFSDEPLSLCIKFYESLDGNISILDTKMCETIFDI
tara:strand:- start:1228 stop:1548 length:321 start_codon:yes stop_codon:yes gene_type:complete